MKTIAIFTFLFLTFAVHAEYEDNLVGTCHVVNKDLRANFYVRNSDKHFHFKYVNSAGEVVDDNSVKHRQNIFTKKYGIKEKNGKIIIKARESYYKADLVFYIEKESALFKHKRSCIRPWLFEPCEVYVEKYEVRFNNCNLDFTDYLDY